MFLIIQLLVKIGTILIGSRFSRGTNSKFHSKLKDQKHI